MRPFQKASFFVQKRGHGMDERLEQRNIPLVPTFRVWRDLGPVSVNPSAKIFGQRCFGRGDVFSFALRMFDANKEVMRKFLPVEGLRFLGSVLVDPPHATVDSRILFHSAKMQTNVLIQGALICENKLPRLLSGSTKNNCEELYAHIGNVAEEVINS
jgi:hypothetical protein